MQVTFNIAGGKMALKKIEQIEDAVGSKVLMARLAHLLKFAILESTAQGIDSKGKPFKPYSPAWAAFRDEEGRPTDKVDLFFKGTMLGDMTYRVTGKLSAELYFADAQQGLKAHGHHYGYPPRSFPSRSFFAASQDDIKKIEEEALRFFMTGKLSGPAGEELKL